MKRTALLLLALLTLPALPAAAQVKHNCAFCHDLHGGSYTALGMYATSQALCESCHGDAGPGFVDRDGVQVAVPKNVPIHNGTKHTTPTSCWSCHDHEGEALGNLEMIPRSRTGAANATTRPVVFTARTGAKSYADGDATYDGVCEVCHTLTSQHRFDGSTGKHNAATNCTNCHKHDTGFQGSGRCTTCHNQTQGTRRAIVPDFNNMAHHVNWQAAGYPVADSIPDADCTICHDQSEHQLGRVRLWNTDQPGNLATVITLTGNPNTTTAEATKLEPHCLSCHDANGAAGDTIPFSDNVVRPRIDATIWSSALHATSPLVPAGCYGDGTNGCHATAHGSQKRHLLAPAATLATAPDYATEEEGFCYVCHDGSPATKNIQAEFAKGTNNNATTPPTIYHHPVVNSQKPTGRSVECVSCHNAHVAQADAVAPTPPAAYASLMGVDRVSVTNGAKGTVPTYTFRSAADATPAKEYEVCFKCHSSYIAVPTGKTNMAVVFNPNDSSYHPVEAAGKNRNINALAFVNGWTWDKTMYCTDCHTSDNTAVRGPHGSTNRYILKKPYTASPNTRTMTRTELCFDCHKYATYDSTGSTINGYSRFNSSGHRFHVVDKGYPCYACHTTHGAATLPFLLVTGRAPGLVSFSRTTSGFGGGSCNATCHSGGAGGTETYTAGYGNR